MTRRQYEALEELKDAVSQETATWVSGDLHRVAMGLAQRGVLNVAYDPEGRLVFWIRQSGEAKSGARLPAGFVVILNRDFLTPDDRRVNFFLFRTKKYDQTQTQFREMLARALKRLGLRQSDLIQSIHVEQVSYDEAMFRNKDHVVLEY